MTGDELKAVYRSFVMQPMIVRRYTGSGNNRPRFDALVRGHARAYDVEELIGTIVQGDQRVVVLAEDLIAKQINLPVTVADKVVLDGREMAIQASLARKALDGTLIAYELQVRG